MRFTNYILFTKLQEIFKFFEDNMDDFSNMQYLQYFFSEEVYFYDCGSAQKILQYAWMDQE